MMSSCQLFKALGPKCAHLQATPSDGGNRDATDAAMKTRLPEESDFPSCRTIGMLEHYSNHQSVTDETTATSTRSEQDPLLKRSAATAVSIGF
jgi:hypothetical protein